MARRKHIRGRCGGGGSVRLSGMPSSATIHLDARDLVSGSNYDPGTSRVSSWPSRNGSVTMAQAAASKQPLYQASGFGASPGVLFDGSDDILWSAYSAQSTQTISMIAGFRYTGGASNYHQGCIGGVATAATENASDDYYNGAGIRPTSPAGHADGFTVYNGPSAGSGYNYRSSQPPGAASSVLSLGSSWTYVGGTNVVHLSRMGSTASITGASNDFDLPNTFKSISVGGYNYGVLEGQMTEVRVWDRALSQVELNRATRIMNGRLA